MLKIYVKVTLFDLEMSFKVFNHMKDSYTNADNFISFQVLNSFKDLQRLLRFNLSVRNWSKI